MCVGGVACVTSYALFLHGKRRILAERAAGSACTAARSRWQRWMPFLFSMYAALLGTQSVIYGKTLAILLRTTLTGDSQIGNWCVEGGTQGMRRAAGFRTSAHSEHPFSPAAQVHLGVYFGIHNICCVVGHALQPGKHGRLLDVRPSRRPRTHRPDRSSSGVPATRISPSRHSSYSLFRSSILYS